jgi:selenocysteine lyase/cysteine desulfurase
LAHQTAGTLPEGTVRAGFSAFNTGREVDIFLQTVEKLRKSP